MDPSTGDVQSLLDRQKIYDAITAHARGIDRCDFAALCEAYWDDAIFAGSTFTGPFRETWGPRFIETVQRDWAITQHNIHNFRVRIESPLAFAETYILSYHRTGMAATREEIERAIGREKLEELGGKVPGCYEFLVGGRNLDRLEKRGEMWKIAHRRVVFDWSHVGAYSGLLSGGRYDAIHNRGCQGPSDPSYTW